MVSLPVGDYVKHSDYAALQARVVELANLDCEAATHVESVIAMRTGFTGDPPYVGWKGLGLALNEALDAKEAAEQRVATLEPLLSEAESIPDYDAGLLNDWGGGNVEWWQDYLRAEIARANEHWRACVAQLKEGRG